jgi:CRP-like cAMP-binding protein
MVEITRLEVDRIVSESGWLAYVSKEIRTEVLRQAVLMRFAPGESIFRFGDPVGGIYGLVAGTVTVNSAPPDATPRPIHLGIPGAGAGEGSFMTGQPRRGELRALGETWMMRVPQWKRWQLAILTWCERLESSRFFRWTC